MLRILFRIKLPLLIWGFILNWKTIWILSCFYFHDFRSKICLSVFDILLKGVFRSILSMWISLSVDLFGFSFEDSGRSISAEVVISSKRDSEVKFVNWKQSWGLLILANFARTKRGPFWASKGKPEFLGIHKGEIHYPIFSYKQ